MNTSKIHLYRVSNKQLPEPEVMIQSSLLMVEFQKQYDTDTEVGNSFWLAGHIGNEFGLLGPV